MKNSIYDFAAKDLNGQERALNEFAGKVLLVVNVASHCAFTPQYRALQALYQKYGPDDFSVLGFPCNQFAEQEPEAEAAIQSFCEQSYGVTFPLFSKIAVNGENAHPLFDWLKVKAPGVGDTKSVKWNFTKFLVNRSGTDVVRFGPSTSPEAIAPSIEKLLVE